MKRSISLCLIALLTFATALHADETTTNEPIVVTKLPEKSGPVTEGCQFSLSSPKVTYRYVQPIPLHIEIKNVNAEILHISSDQLFNMYRFDVRLPDGEPAPLTLYGQLLNQRPFFGSSVTITLKRDEADTDEVLAINRIYDMTLEGEYTITVYRKNYSVNGTFMKTEVPSNELKITVTDEAEQQDEQADEPRNEKPKDKPAAKSAVKAGPEKLGCQLRVTSPKSSYRFGQSIQLHLEVENVNADVAYFSKENLFSMYRFDVRFPDGKAVPMTVYGKLYHQGPFFGSMVFVKLKRGMTDTDVLEAINQTYDMTLAGEYTITAYRQIFTLGEDKQNRIDVTSNQLKITVTEEVELQAEQADEQKSDQEAIQE